MVGVKDIADRLAGALGCLLESMDPAKPDTQTALDVESAKQALAVYDQMLENDYERAVDALDARGLRPSEVCRTVEDCVRQMESLSQEHGYGRG